VRHWATVCRAEQLPVLLASMRRHCAPFMLHVLAWDFDPHDEPYLGPDVEVTPRLAFLLAHPALAPDRLPGPPRSPVDTVATIRWAFFLDVLETLRGELLTTLDGDLWLWSSPDPMFAEIPDGAPLAVSPHRIPPASAGLPGVTLETHACYGRFNSGLSVWRDPAPLREMAEATRLWSYTEVVERPGRRPLFGDQSALEDVAEKHGAHVIQHPGVNVAPWNLHAARLRELTPPGGPPLPTSYPVVGDPPQPLILYHYSSLRFAPDGALRQLADASYGITPWQARVLYEPYLAALRGNAAGRIEAP